MYILRISKLFYLSIVIPVFNGAPNIYNTIESIIANNTIGNIKDKIEIVVIDDGSTDNTKNIVYSFIEKNKSYTIKYFYQENSGLSCARNKGLKCALGKYIWFFDADDLLIDDNLKTIFAWVTDGQVDVISFKSQLIKDNILYGYGCDYPVEKNKCINGLNAFEQGYSPSSVCCLIIKKDLFYSRNIFFYPNISHQDVELTAKLIISIEKIIFLNIAPYGYVYNSDSISKSKSREKYIKYALDNLVVANSLKDYSSSLDDNKKKYILRVINNIIWNYIYNLFISRRYIDFHMLNLFLDELFSSNSYPMQGKMETKFQKMTSIFFKSPTILKVTLFFLYRLFK